MPDLVTARAGWFLAPSASRASVVKPRAPALGAAPLADCVLGGCHTEVMSPLSASTLGGEVPLSVDGRSYPEHLRAYHANDDQLLPLVARLAPATFDELAAKIEDSRVRSALPHWLSSAEWRGLVVRASKDVRSRRAYSLGPKAPEHVRHAA